MSPNLHNSANLKYIYEIAEENLHNNNLKVNTTMSQKRVIVCTILLTSNISMKLQRKISTTTI
jgi:hypothetical protein